MVETDDRYFECPVCHWALTFRLVNDKYVSYCPFCRNRLEMTKEEFERDDIEIYFEKDF